MSNRFLLGKDVNGNVDYSLPIESTKFSITLLQNSAQPVTVPDFVGMWKIVFSFEPGAKIWVAFDSTAALPAGNTFASTTSILNPTTRYMKQGTIISFITNDQSAEIGIECFLS